MRTAWGWKWALAAVLALPAAPAAAQNGPGGRNLAQILAAKRRAEQQKQLETQRQAAKKKAPGDDKFYGSTQKRQNLHTWAGSLGKPLTADGLDQLLAEDIGPPAGTTTDETFLRRAYLALIGELPSPADVREFLANPASNKREQVVDKLLALPQFGKNLARRWHDAVSYRNTAGKNRELPYLGFEAWLAGQFNANASWGEIVSAILAVRGPAAEHPEGLFFGAHGDAAPELAGESARLFLGMQLGCAQCHDHPNEHWKREQFHELAAFFGRVEVQFRAGKDGGPPTAGIGEKPPRRVAKKKDNGFAFDGEYYMPDLKNPAVRGTLTTPMFLTGKKLPLGASDADRRGTLAAAVTAKNNPNFARSLVNHAWAELVGVPFTEHVDDLGDGKSQALPKTFEALAKSFAASNYDLKKLYRLVALSAAFGGEYGSASEGGDAEHGVRPARLASTQVFDALSWALGDLGPDRAQIALPKAAGRGGLSMQIEREFGFDPALDAGHLDASVPQALLLMNHPGIAAKIGARNPASTLGKLLKNHPKDNDAVEALFLRTLARRPSAAETQRSLSYLGEIANRGIAYEDLFWALLNTTEFVHHR